MPSLGCSDWLHQLADDQPARGCQMAAWNLGARRQHQRCRLRSVRAVDGQRDESLITKAVSVKGRDTTCRPVSACCWRPCRCWLPNRFGHHAIRLSASAVAGEWIHADNWLDAGSRRATLAAATTFMPAFRLRHHQRRSAPKTKTRTPRFDKIPVEDPAGGSAATGLPAADQARC